MKKNILKAAIVAAFALIAGFNMYNAQKPDGLSDLALANVEALAGGEETGGRTCYKTITTMEGSQILYCGTCSWVSGTKAWNSGSGNC